MMEFLRVENAGFYYQPKKYIFRDIDFTLNGGEALCIIGAHGCGKTTLLDCALGLTPLVDGKVFVGGRLLADMKPADIAKEMAYIPQSHKTTFAYTVLDVVTMGRTSALGPFSAPGREEREIAMCALEEVGMTDFADRTYTTLSGGELQLVIIARAIAQEAKVLVMDEPTSHLDFFHEMKVMEIIAELVMDKGMSVLMATHFLNQAYFLENIGVKTKVALMKDGGFSSEGVPSVMLTTENLEETFNIATEIVQDSRHTRKYILPLGIRR
jgi:iron complex transport system ATP-binding protein